MRVLLTGDSHGTGLRRASLWAREEKADVLVVAGDIWVTDEDRDLPTYLIPGNHEEIPRGSFDSEKEPTWFGRNVFAFEDYSTFQLGGLKWGTLGRMDDEAHKELLEHGWWLGEKRNRSFVKDPEASQKLKQCDVLLTHDCAHPYLYGTTIGGSKFISGLLETIQPTFHFHGHAHEFALKKMPYGTLSIGLAPCDLSFPGGYVVLQCEPRLEWRAVVNPTHARGATSDA